MILDNAKRAIALNSKEKPVVARLRFNAKGKLLGGELFKGDYRETKGVYTIRYNPSSEPRKAALGEYTVSADIWPRYHTTRCKSYDDLVAKYGDITEVKFLLQWSTISAKLFEVARANPGVCIPFVLDAGRYNDYLKGLYEKENGNPPPEDMPLLSNELIDNISVETRDAYWRAIKRDGKVAQDIRNAAAGRRNN